MKKGVAGIAVLAAVSVSACGQSASIASRSNLKKQAKTASAPLQLAGTKWKSVCHGVQGWGDGNHPGQITVLEFESTTRLHKYFYQFADSDCRKLAAVDEVAGGYLVGHGTAAQSDFNYSLVYWASTPMAPDTLAVYQARYPALAWAIGQRTEVTSESNTECEAGHGGDKLDLIAAKNGQLFVGKYDSSVSSDVRPTEVDFAIPYSPN